MRLNLGASKWNASRCKTPQCPMPRTKSSKILSAFSPPRSKDVRLPVQLQRAMAAEAEAAREARAKVIAAEGEYKASTALKEASMVIAQSPAALQLRYLQVHH